MHVTVWIKYTKHGGIVSGFVRHVPDFNNISCLQYRGPLVTHANNILADSPTFLLTHIWMVDLGDKLDFRWLNRVSVAKVERKLELAARIWGVRGT